MTQVDPAVSLENMGFSPLEAEVYVLLLQRPASTGYRVAQELGKAAAGIYKALDALAKRGAVVVDDDGTKSWRAVPAKEMLAQAQSRYHTQHQAALASLQSLGTVADDEKVYRLSNFDHVVERARQMLARAENVAVVDVFPAAVELIREAVIDAVQRGVRVYAKVYRPIELPGAMVSVSPASKRLLRVWTADWLNVVIDAQEHLLALLDCDRTHVHQATWTSSSYLSILYYSGITSEIRVDSLGAAIDSGASLKQIKALRNSLNADLAKCVPSGVRQLQQQLLPGRNDSNGSTAAKSQTKKRSKRNKRRS